MQFILWRTSAIHSAASPQVWNTVVACIEYSTACTSVLCIFCKSWTPETWSHCLILSAGHTIGGFLFFHLEKLEIFLSCWNHSSYCSIPQPVGNALLIFVVWALFSTIVLRKASKDHQRDTWKMRECHMLPSMHFNSYQHMFNYVFSLVS